MNDAVNEVEGERSMRAVFLYPDAREPPRSTGEVPALNLPITVGLALLTAIARLARARVS